MSEKKEKHNGGRPKSGYYRLTGLRMSRDINGSNTDLRGNGGTGTLKASVTGRINETFSKLRRGSIRTATMVSSAAARRRSKLKYKRTWNNIYRIATRGSFVGDTVVAPIEAEEDSDESLFEKIHESLFNQKITRKRYRDIIRTAHCVSIEFQDAANTKQICTAAEDITAEHEPDKNIRDMSRMVLIIEKLALFFAKVCEEEDGEDIDEKCIKLVSHANEFIDTYKTSDRDPSNFTLKRLFEELEAYIDTVLVEKVQAVLNFLHLSVVIFAMEELHTKLKLGPNHLRKDVEWKIKVRLTGKVVEIFHTRREGVLKPKGENNYWEIKYKLAMSFSPDMTKFNSVGLTLNDLKLADTIDDSLADELKDKFCNGNSIIC